METVILTSVLATLGVVTIIGLIVVAFVKLKSKVDSTDYESDISDIHRRVDELSHSNNKDLHSAVDHLHRTLEDTERNLSQQFNEVQNNIDESYRFTDSRCDKLYAEMHNLDK